MSELVNINEFLRLRTEIPVVDVRSPAEFEQGHIHGALNIPLFNDQERAVVGTLYKNSGQKDAVLAGLEIAGRKMRSLAESGFKAAKNKKLLVHCWRGGMRSSSMSWLLETCGIQCFVLSGGYKSYRQFIRQYFTFPFDYLIIGGMTGCGKTAILEEIGKQHHQVLNLEEIAHHKGSAFGSLGESVQNTNEQFENDLYNVLSGFDLSKPVFLEDESRNIGRNTIPRELFDAMNTSRLVIAEMDSTLRLQRLLNDYGSFAKEELITCIEKISKRLGGQNTRAAIDSIREDNILKAAEISLHYYDKTYGFGLANKKNRELISIKLETTDPIINAKKILKVLQEKNIIPEI